MTSILTFQKQSSDKEQFRFPFARSVDWCAADLVTGILEHMGTRLLHTALDEGYPLVDVVVTFVDGIDYAKATIALNELAEDFDLYPHAHYGLDRTRIGSATMQALERIFGCNVQRVAMVHYDTAAEAMLPDYESCYWEVSDPIRFPIPGMIESLSFPQPGNDDNGQWIEPERVARDRAMRWELWRQDDGGNAYHITTYSTELTAIAAMRAFEKRGHKQVYWVTATPKN